VVLLESNPLLLVIVGPTGSGKSHLGVAMATQLGGEIVNADSVQLYRGFNIGSAKTPVGERRGIAHHLLDVLEADAVASAGEYARMARACVQEIAGRGRVPIVVGGTGFYIRALLDGLPTLPGRDEGVRARLGRRPEARLHPLLRRLDPAAAARLHPSDTQRLIRALEVRIVTGRAMPSARDAEALKGYRVVQIGLNPPRESLAERTAERARRMFAMGLIEEVRGLLAEGWSGSEKPFQSLGYKEALAQVRGELTLEGAIEATAIATRQYAKRQRTWFRSDERIRWIDGFGDATGSVADAISLVRQADTGYTVNDA
jgi:tRNA dimethylallyltransferase